MGEEEEGSGGLGAPLASSPSSSFRSSAAGGSVTQSPCGLMGARPRVSALNVSSHRRP